MNFLVFFFSGGVHATVAVSSQTDTKHTHTHTQNEVCFGSYIAVVQRKIQHCVRITNWGKPLLPN